MRMEKPHIIKPPLQLMGLLKRAYGPIELLRAGCRYRVYRGVFMVCLPGRCVFFCRDGHAKAVAVY